MEYKAGRIDFETTKEKKRGNRKCLPEKALSGGVHRRTGRAAEGSGKVGRIGKRDIDAVLRGTVRVVLDLLLQLLRTGQAAPGLKKF